MSTDPGAVAFRLRQELQLRTLEHTQGWQRLQSLINRRWSERRVVQFLSDSRPLVIAPEGASAFLELVECDSDLRSEVLETAHCIRERRFAILAADVPQEGDWPWHSDWRFGHSWSPAYYRNYGFYEARSVPYDIKYPWELSRLTYLIPLLQANALDPDGGWAEAAVEILLDWESHNPLAYSVNWHPMEASMRSLSLLLAFEMLRSQPNSSPEFSKPFLRQLEIHGEFIWRNLEYTDVRGNHYVANITALVLLGLLLRGHSKHAASWAGYGIRALEEEVRQQICSDGVFFDRSVAYHRLVTELFLLAAIGLDRRGFPLSTPSTKRMYQACRYAWACRRPDGLAPNIGDNDSARVLNFDPLPLMDFSDLVNLASTFFEDPGMHVKRHGELATAWLLGKPTPREIPTPSTATDICIHYPESGIVICRKCENYLWMDIGRFGKRGRGGHGHNDLFSFELALRGQVLIEDPGCPVYAADSKLRNRFRGTASHNGLRVDGAEIVELVGLWEIGEDRAPFDVEVREDGGTVLVSAAHDHFARLKDPVIHRRRLKLDYRRGMLECCDLLESRSEHLYERFLHVAPGVGVQLGNQGAVLSAADQCFQVEWNASAEARVEEGLSSPGYGAVVPTRVIRLVDHGGESRLFFKIAPRQ